jgi:hypothetical protein
VDPNSISRWTLRRYALVVAAVTTLRVILAIVLPVSGDEAEYWDMSRHLAGGYLDHPPLLFWLIAGSRAIFGETSLAVRFPSIVSSALLSFLLVPLTRRLGGTIDHAAYAHAIMLATPFFFLGSFYAWTDALLITFYLGAVLAIVAGSATGLGVAVGAGFLTKFPILLVLPALWKSRFDVRKLAAAALLGAAITTPLWIWSWQHDWVNFRFQFLDRHEGDGGLEPSAFFDFVLAHLLLFTPFIVAAIGIAWWKSRRRHPALAIAALMPVLVFGLVALRERSGAHWGGPGLIVGCVMVAMTDFRGRRALVRAGAVLCAVSVTAALLILTFADRIVRYEWRYPFSPVTISTKYLAYAVGNEEIAVRALERLQPGEMVATENYTNAHLWAFLTKGELPTRVAWIKKRAKSGLPSLYWYTPGELRGRNFLFLTEKSGFDDELRRLFASVEEEEPIVVRRHGRIIRTVRALRCRNLLLPEGTFTLVRSR